MNNMANSLFCCPLCKCDLEEFGNEYRCTSCSGNYRKEGIVHNFLPTYSGPVDALLSHMKNGLHGEWFNALFKCIHQDDYCRLLSDPKIREIGRYTSQLADQGINLGERYDTQILPEGSCRDLHELDVAFRHLPELSRRKVALDIGCGTLRVTKRLLKMGFERVIAIDLLPELMLYGYERLSRDDQQKVTLMKADVRYLPLRDNVIDLAFSLELFEHINAPTQMLFDLKRALVKEGTAVFNTWNALTRGNRLKVKNSGKAYYDNGFYYVFYEKHEIEEILRTLGVQYEIRTCGCAIGRRLIHYLGEKIGKKVLWPVVAVDGLLSSILPASFFPFIVFKFSKTELS